MRFEYPVKLTRAVEGGFVVTCRDLPEVVTQGEDRDDAIENAEGAVQAAVEFRVGKGMDLPSPSRMRAGEVLAAVPVLTALKAALFLAMRRQRGAISALARELGIDEKAVRRMLDPKHPTKAPAIERALGLLGHRPVVTVE